MDLIERLDKWVKENRPSVYEKLLPGLSSEEISRLEKDLGVALPDQMRAFLEWRNGQTLYDVESFYYNYTLMDAGDIGESNDMLNELLEGGDFDRENWWNPKWVPFMANGAGDYYCVDMEGSFGGQVGQVLEFNHDYEARDIQFPSFAKWLETTVEAFEAGLFEYGDYGMEPVDDEQYQAVRKRISPGYPVKQKAG
jgi:cell wall assembly regulator SMI1